MKRITPAEVVAAYAKLGAKPMQSVYYKRGQDGELDCYCGLGAVIAVKHAGDKPPECIRDESVAEYGRPYVSGFTSGFDGQFACGHVKSARQRIGHADGRAAAIAVGLIKDANQ